MYASLDRLGGGILLLVLIIFAVPIRAGAAGAGQEEGTPERPRGKSSRTMKEALEKAEAAQRAALKALGKEVPKTNPTSPPAVTMPKTGAPDPRNRISPAPTAGIKGNDQVNANDGVKKLVRNADGTWTIPMFPIEAGKGIRGASEFPPEDYLLRHATEVYGLTAAD